MAYYYNGFTLPKILPKILPKMFEQIEQAIFAGGCFWGLEYYFKLQKGVKNTQVGYIGGKIQQPSYQQVCAGNSGHIEAIAIDFNSKKISYLDITKLFFELHDPTQVDGQGPDIGSQYLSAIFYHNAQQQKTAQLLITTLANKGYKIATKLYPASTFWNAEEYHQDYYTKNSLTPYCHKYTARF